MAIRLNCGRFRAFDLKSAGCAHEEVTQAPRATKAAVSKRMQAVRESGKDSLQVSSQRSRAKLMPEALGFLPELLAERDVGFGVG
jgi:hypothetical protein